MDNNYSELLKKSKQNKKLVFSSEKSTKKCTLEAGADLGFSRGGGGGFSKILSTFFHRSTELIFRALPTHTLVPVLGKVLKKQSKKGVFGNFWKILTKKTAFFWRARPPQISIYWCL